MNFLADLTVLSEVRRERDRQAESEQRLRTAFATAMQGDLTKPATLTQTGAQVLEDALGSKDFMPRAMQILAHVAAGNAAMGGEARQLLAEAGAHWAWLNAE